MLRQQGYVPHQTQWPVTDAPLVLTGAHPNRIWLLTIRHTGTHYMFQHLDRLGFFQGHIDHQQKRLKNARDAPYFLHSHIESTPIMHFVCGDPVIMTMRNPADVYLSHLNRYPWHEGYHLTYVLAAFDLFEKVCERYDAFMFKVDTEDQETEVMRLSAWLDVEFNYREQPKDINHDGRVRDVDQHVPNEIFELAKHYGY